MSFYIITGAPCSGKSTYVRNRLGERDIVFDYDAVARAITGKQGHTLANKRHARKTILAMRAAAIEAWKRGGSGAENFFLISSSIYPPPILG